MSETDAALPETPPLQVARPGWRPLVVGLVAGLVVGGGGVGLAWALADTKPADENVDVTAACTLVRKASQPDLVSSPYAIGRWSGAFGLAKVAAESDSRYEPLSDALLQVVVAAARDKQAEGPEFEKVAQKARDLCAGH